MRFAEKGREGEGRVDGWMDGWMGFGYVCMYGERYLMDGRTVKKQRRKKKRKKRDIGGDVVKGEIVFDMYKKGKYIID